jgi:hypothetical protein
MSKTVKKEQGITSAKLFNSDIDDWITRFILNDDEPEKPL